MFDLPAVSENEEGCSVRCRTQGKNVLGRSTWPSAFPAFVLLNKPEAKRRFDEGET